jgi:AMP-activated protein kinase-like protein
MIDRLDDAIELLKTPPALSVESRVMAEVRRMSGPAPMRRRVFTWPRFATLGLALAAGLAAILLIPRSTGTLTPGESEGIAQFVGHFPGARSVEVVGSFNNWSRGLLHLRDENHDGIWHAAAVLPAGQHEYMFVVDGERWVTDPLAGRFVDDGFGGGRENSVLIVRPAVQR